MGRLNKDHSSWNAHGLYLKYKNPAIPEQTAKSKSKKNTNKWCKGKVGVEHKLVRIFHRTYNNGRGFDYDFWNGLFNYTVCQCLTCGKQLYRNNSKGIPLIIPVRLESVTTPVQVKVNGKAIPIDFRHYQKENFCYECMSWHKY